MRATHRRLVAAFLPVLLGLGACGEDLPVVKIRDGKVTVDGKAVPVWPKMTVVAREGTAVLEIKDDEVFFQGVSFEGTARIVIPTMIGVTEANLGYLKQSFVFDEARETMQVSVGELRFTFTRDGEWVEFDGRRADLSGGAKRAVFTKDGGLEVSDQE